MFIKKDSVMSQIRLLLLVGSILCSLMPQLLEAYGLSSLAPNDPYPMFTAQYPQTFLLNRARRCYMFRECCLQPEWWDVHVSAFKQSASTARNFFKEKVVLGDIYGRWNMLGLVYDDNVQIISPTLKKFLNPTPADEQVCVAYLRDPANSDTRKHLGFFTVPVDYSKHGLRIDGSWQILCDFGIHGSLSFADIRQINPRLEDLSTKATPICVETLRRQPDGEPVNLCEEQKCAVFGTTCDCLKYLEKNLMDRADTILAELGYNTDNFHRSDLEFVNLGCYWRRAFIFNEGDCFYPQFLCIPYVTIEGAVPVSRVKENFQLFAAPFGNNGHGAFAGMVGATFAFHDTVEVGAEVSATHFFPRLYCDLHLPTNTLQQTIFPFSANVDVEPGDNWEFSIFMYAPRFLNKLSMYAQYVYVSHSEDRYTIVEDLRLRIPGVRDTTITSTQQTISNAPNLPPFQLKRFAELSKWEVQLANIGFSYELSPGISAAFLWQAPLKGRNVYRSTTIMFTLTGTY